MQKVPGLYVGSSDIEGRGVFCAHSLTTGDIIEICPVIVLDSSDLQLIDNTGLYDYYWLWGEKRTMPAIVLGYGSLYNHSFTPNAETEIEMDENQIIFRALKEIREHEEILIDYSSGEQEYRDLWFKRLQ